MMIFKDINKDTMVTSKYTKVSIEAWTINSILDAVGIRGIANLSMDPLEISYDSEYFELVKKGHDFNILVPNEDTEEHFEYMRMGDVENMVEVECSYITRPALILHELLVKKGILGLDSDEVGYKINIMYNTKYFKHISCDEVTYIDYLSGSDMHIPLIESERYIHEFGGKF